MGVRLDPAPAAALMSTVTAMLAEPRNLTAIRNVADAVDRHLADSLSALALPEIARAESFLDLGSGAGFPGLALAAARPELAVTLVESKGAKAEWLRRASAQFPNVWVVGDRSERLALRERERWDIVGARALGPLPVTLELAAPLVRVGGHVAVWRGESDAAAEASGDAAAARLGLDAGSPRPTRPFPGASRHIRIFRKARRTDDRFPRRPGRAAKRPLA